MSTEWKAALARELASEALFDEGVEAARNACVAGASIASAAITAAAWYDNPLTGVPALRDCMSRLCELPLSVSAWNLAFRRGPHPETSDPDFAPGFGFVSPAQTEHLLAACARLADSANAPERERSYVAFFLRNHGAIAEKSGPLNQAGLAALVFTDHGADLEDAERWFLSWRIETAIREAQRARRRGVGAFPFFSERYVYEGTWPEHRQLDMAELLKQAGLE